MKSNVMDADDDADAYTQANNNNGKKNLRHSPWILYNSIEFSKTETAIKLFI